MSLIEKLFEWKEHVSNRDIGALENELRKRVRTTMGWSQPGACSNGYYAFLHALDTFQFDMAELLVRYGVNTNAAGYGISPLGHVVATNNHPALNWMINNCTDLEINIQWYGYPALFYIVDRHSIDTVKAFLRHKDLDINVEAKWQGFEVETVFVVALGINRIDVAALFMDRIHEFTLEHLQQAKDACEEYLTHDGNTKENKAAVESFKARVIYESRMKVLVPLCATPYKKLPTEILLLMTTYL